MDKIYYYVIARVIVCGEPAYFCNERHRTAAKPVMFHPALSMARRYSSEHNARNALAKIRKFNDGDFTIKGVCDNNRMIDCNRL